MTTAHLRDMPEERAAAFAREAPAAFRELVLKDEFPCLGAKAAFHSESFSLDCFPEIATEAATLKLSAALFEFTQSERTAASEYATFIAIFEGPCPTDER